MPDGSVKEARAFMRHLKSTTPICVVKTYGSHADGFMTTIEFDASYDAEADLKFASVVNVLATLIEHAGPDGFVAMVALARHVARLQHYESHDIDGIIVERSGP